MANFSYNLNVVNQNYAAYGQVSAALTDNLKQTQWIWNYSPDNAARG